MVKKVALQLINSHIIFVADSVFFSIGVLFKFGRKLAIPALS